jgi:hypothetical protein
LIQGGSIKALKWQGLQFTSRRLLRSQQGGSASSSCMPTQNSDRFQLELAIQADFVLTTKRHGPIVKSIVMTCLCGQCHFGNPDSFVRLLTFFFQILLDNERLIVYHPSKGFDTPSSNAIFSL